MVKDGVVMVYSFLIAAELIVKYYELSRFIHAL